MESLIYAGTGHRPEKLGGHTMEVFEKLVRYVNSLLISYNPKKIISGMALGWDMALAQGALNANIPLIAAVPFIGQEIVWRPEQQELYHAILAKAEQVVICSEGGYASIKYQIRDEWMVDNSDALLALWNGDKKGGTFNTVKYAKKIEKPMFNVWPGWSSWENEDAA